ncbi:acyltransferase family protein [Massilia sp. LjRoot122]|uniref:acyltransferase family protein n=1 Tax=Massilia sp. LjRoot122 TaxID=3342257 RepID=UPI003ECCE2AE
MLQNLQVLRALAALLVVVHHFLLANRDSGQGGIANFFYLSEVGACGVDLFFCISGFVMLGSIAKKGDFSPAEFATGRVIRIIPAYWIVSTLFIALVGLNHISKSGFGPTLAKSLFSPDFILSSYLLIPVINPESGYLQPFLAQGWTLSYELYFYVLLMCAAVLAKANPVRTAVLGGFYLLAGLLVFWRAEGAIGTFFGNSIVLEFVLGMGVFILARKTRVLGVQAILLGFVLLAATALFKVENRVLLWGIPSALILYGFVALEGVLRAPRLLKAMGDASYSLYLTHGVLTYIYGGLLKRGWFASTTKQNIAVLGGTVVAVLLAFVFYRFVEKPLLERFKQKRRAPSTVPVA